MNSWNLISWRSHVFTFFNEWNCTWYQQSFNKRVAEGGNLTEQGWVLFKLQSILSRVLILRRRASQESRTYSTKSLDRHWSIREIPWCNLCCNKQGSKTFFLCYCAHDFWKISSIEIISKNAVQTKGRTRLDQTTNHNNFIKPLITFIVYTSITVFFSFTDKKNMIFTLAIHFIYLKIPINTF